MKWKLFLSLLIFCSLNVFGQESPQGRRAKESEKTCWGWIIGHSAEDGGTVGQIRGTVEDEGGEPIGGSLIEVFTDTDLDLEKRRRVAAYWTKADGKFRFGGLPAGRYELRGSICGKGFDAGSDNLRPV